MFGKKKKEMKPTGVFGRAFEVWEKSPAQQLEGGGVYTLNHLTTRRRAEGTRCSRPVLVPPVHTVQEEELEVQGVGTGPWEKKRSFPNKNEPHKPETHQPGMTRFRRR